MTHPPVPLVDMNANYARLKDRIDSRVQAVLADGRYIMGPEVTELEAELGRRAGVKHAIGCASGTDALILPLRAAGIGPGDAVIVPSFTFVASAGAVVMAGATPIFCDVDRDSFAIDVDDMARRAQRITGGLKLKAVMPVDLFGLPADYGPIRDFASTHGLMVLADAAQSYGGSRGGVAVGKMATVSATSFYPTKPLGTYGDGGAIFTDDDELAAKIRLIRVHGQGATGVAELPGTNSRLDTIQAAILLAKLEVFDEDLKRRAEVAARFDARLGGHVGLQARPAGAVSTHAVYSILTEKRGAVRAALADAKIASRIYYDHPVHLMPAMRQFGEGEGSLPASEWLSERILGLPIYPEMDDATVDRVCDVILAALG